VSAKRRSSSKRLRLDAQHVAFCTAAQLLARTLATLSERLLIEDVEVQMLDVSREVTKLIEGQLQPGRRPSGENVVDLVRRTRLRTLFASLGGAPNRPPRAPRSA
jgi:hypothetical protein